MSDVQRLREAIDRMEAAYNLAREDLEQGLERDRPCMPDHFKATVPEQMPDKNGRYILLDALTAIIQARTALAQAVNADG